MIATVVAMALVALYANIQKARRKEIETVIVTPVLTPAATATPVNR